MGSRIEDRLAKIERLLGDKNKIYSTVGWEDWAGLSREEKELQVDGKIIYLPQLPFDPAKIEKIWNDDLLGSESGK